MTKALSTIPTATIQARVSKFLASFMIKRIRSEINKFNYSARAWWCVHLFPIYLAPRTATWSCLTQSVYHRVPGNCWPIFESHMFRSVSSGTLRVVSEKERFCFNSLNFAFRLSEWGSLTIFGLILIGSKRSHNEESFSPDGCLRNSAVKLRTW